MQKTPLVSVIINCFNGEKFLVKAINSVLNQSYKNWEIIFFDNNSTDNSFRVIKKFNDKRIRYFRSSKTETLYKARNLAVDKSKGKFISFLDVDDWWKKNKLKKQVDFFCKYKNIDIIYSNVYLFYEKQKIKKLFIKNKLHSGKFTQKLIDKYQLPILSSIIKKKIFKQIKFDERYSIIGDFDFFIRLSLKKPIFAIQEPLAYYRIHNSNLSKKKISLNIFELKSWINEKHKQNQFKKIDFSKLYNSLEILKIQKTFIEKNFIKFTLLLLKNFFRLFKFNYL